MPNTDPHIFSDHEVTAAIQEVFSHKGLMSGMQMYLPKEFFQEIQNNLSSVKTVYDFQGKIIHPLINLIEEKSVKQLHVSGLEFLDPNESYLFISNHRDIVLDSAFINNSLFKNKYPTSQIAIGDNLMVHRLSELIFKLNKSFVVKRLGSPMELYRYSVKLSAYISDLIHKKTDSVWIAQREGRAKDGNDETQVGLLKMLSLSSKLDLSTFFKSLKVVPVSISYEYNPCDHLITQEYLNKKSDPAYKKPFKADVEHILTGLWGQKGRVHLHFDRYLDTELNTLDSISNKKQQLSALKTILDSKIQQNYKLNPINYVAADLLSGKQEFNAFYTREEYTKISSYFKNKTALIDDDKDGSGKSYLLGMYTTPLKNQMNNKQV